MMQSSYRCQKSEIDFINARQFLLNIGYKPQSQAEKIAWRILDPFGTYFKIRESLSLTDQMDYKNQIRFFLKDRVERMLLNIAQSVKSYLSELTLFHSEELDEGSALFFDLLAREFPVYKSSLTVHFVPALHLGTDETKIVELLKTASPAEKKSEIIYYSQRYLNIGNAWSAEKLLTLIQDDDTETQSAQLLSFAFNMQGKGFQAERLYLKWKSSSRAEDQVRACYVLSMLYARHHQRDQLSIEKAKAFLEEAFAILLKHNEETYIDYTFDKVFNRNGYALILFREAKLQEAAALLEWGIQTIQSHTSPKERMHLSVLYYNVAQVYERLGRFDSCLQALNTLIEIDPLFAEYHAEKARVLLEAFQDTAQAEQEILEALKLDPAVFDCETLYEYLYMFSELESYETSLRIVEVAQVLGLKINDDIRIIIAEAFMNLKNFSKSREYLQTLTQASPEALNTIEAYELETLSAAV